MADTGMKLKTYTNGPITTGNNYGDFQSWYSDLEKTRGVQSPGYDMKAWFGSATPEQRNEVIVDPTKHFTDAYKLPNHITFSDESIYHNDTTPGGKWVQGVDEKWHYYASPFVVQQQGVDKLKSYFEQQEPNSVLHLPGE